MRHVTFPIFSRHVSRLEQDSKHALSPLSFYLPIQYGTIKQPTINHINPPQPHGSIRHHHKHHHVRCPIRSLLMTMIRMQLKMTTTTTSHQPTLAVVLQQQRDCCGHYNLKLSLDERTSQSKSECHRYVASCHYDTMRHLLNRCFSWFRISGDFPY